MVTTVWGIKGGSGTSVVAAALAVLVAERDGEVLLVDRAGDQPAVLGLADPAGPGVLDWLATGSDAAALGRLELDRGDGVALLPAGGAGGAGPATVAPDREAVLAAALVDDRRRVVVDAGTTDSPPPTPGTSLLVVRPCYLALRRAARAAERPDAVVLVREVGRSLDRHDVARVLDAPVRAVVDVDPVVARAVDAGLLATRLPAGLRRALGRLL